MWSQDDRKTVTLIMILWPRLWTRRHVHNRTICETFKGHFILFFPYDALLYSPVWTGINWYSEMFYHVTEHISCLALYNRTPSSASAALITEGVGMFFFPLSYVFADSEIRLEQSQGHPPQQPCHVLKMISNSTSRTCCFDPKEALSNLAVRLVTLNMFLFAL